MKPNCDGQSVSTGWNCAVGLQSTPFRLAHWGPPAAAQATEEACLHPLCERSMSVKSNRRRICVSRFRTSIFRAALSQPAFRSPQGRHRCRTHAEPCFLGHLCRGCNVGQPRRRRVAAAVKRRLKPQRHRRPRLCEWGVGFRTWRVAPRTNRRQRNRAGTLSCKYSPRRTKGKPRLHCSRDLPDQMRFRFSGVRHVPAAATQAAEEA